MLIISRSCILLTLTQVLLSFTVSAAPYEEDMLILEATSPDQDFQAEIDNLLVDKRDSSDKESNIEVLEWSRDIVSKYVETLNDGVDSFFMGAFFDEELVEDESSGSNGRVFLTTRRVIGEGVNYKAGINLKIVLPKTRDRFKLLVETDENEDRQAETDIIGTADNVTYSTAIRVELNEGRHWKTSLDNGIRWSGEPVYFSRIRARRTDYYEDWRSRFLQSIDWRTDVEWGAKLEMTALRPINFTRSFSLGFKADYNLNDDKAELESSVAIFHELDYRAAMLYQLAAFGDTEYITKVNEFVLSVSYRRKIYKNFVFAEIVPEIGFPRDLNYEYTPALNFTLEMIFGPGQD